MRTMILEEGIRRRSSYRRDSADQHPRWRPPRTHGSSLFTRGETQALVVSTLGTSTDEQIVDELEGGARRLSCRTTTSPFSVGEVSPMRGPGRRKSATGP